MLLQSKIHYNEWAKRADIQGAYKLFVVCDSVGKVLKTEFSSLNENCTLTSGDSLFLPNILTAIKSVKWKPGYQNGKPTTRGISIPIVFFLNVNNEINSRALLVIDTSYHAVMRPMYEYYPK